MKQIIYNLYSFIKFTLVIKVFETNKKFPPLHLLISEIHGD